jgi:hypothetical protein
MGGLGVLLTLLGGVIALVAGLTRGDWGVAGLGIALAGIGLLVWEVLIALQPGTNEGQVDGGRPPRP